MIKIWCYLHIWSFFFTCFCHLCLCVMNFMILNLSFFKYFGCDLKLFFLLNYVVVLSDMYKPIYNIY